ncbi:helix-turn-helix domain-containing protein [Maribacter sp.]|nr:helix-turn-helix domain-containing protein [Maribacter sp.]
MITLANFILVAGFAITSVILFMLALVKKKKTPQKILIGFLAITLLIIITVSASIHGLRNIFIATHFFEDGARFILAPLLFLYIKSIFEKGKGLIRKNLFHFIPFLLYWSVFSVPLLISRIEGGPLFGYLEFFNGTAYLALIKDLFLLMYLFLSIRLFLQFKSKMEFNYSSFKDANFVWLKKFLAGFLLVTLFDLIIVGYHIVVQPNLSWDIGLLSLYFLILVTVYLGYHGIRQSTIYLPSFLVNAEIEDLQKFQSSKPVIPEREFEEIKIGLNRVLKEDRPYLLQEITLRGLADLVGTTDKNLSAFLNHKLELSFYDFINRYRVEAVKESLESEEYEKYTLLGIAYSCGFNSKSSFYRAFKKETGCSPTSYKKGMTSERFPTISDRTVIR